MKKNLYYAGMLLLGMLVTTGCSNEETLEQVSSNGKIYQAVIENASGARTSVSDEYKVLWSAEDAFTVFEEGVKAATLTLIQGDGTTSGKFQSDVNKTLADGAVALFPASESLGYTFKESYDSRETDAPMLGSYTNGTFTFNLLTAMVRVVVADVPAGDVTLTLSSESLNLTGDATISNDALGLPTTGKEVTVTLAGSEGGTLTFDVPVPVQNYTDGLKILVKSGQTEVLNKETNPFDAAAGTLYLFGAKYVSAEDAATSLQEAIDASTEGEVIVLTGEEQEIEVPSLSVASGKTAALDLNGKKLKLGAASTTALARSTSATHGIINSGTLTISGGEIVYTSEDVNKYAIYNKTSGNMTLTNVTVESNNNNYGLLNYGVMTIEDGTITFEGNTEANGAAVFNAAQIQLNDVDITSNNGCFMNYGDATKTTLEGLKAEDATVKAVINGGTFNSSFCKSESHTQHRYAVSGFWYSNLTMDGTKIEGSGGVTIDVSFATLTNVNAAHACQYGAHDLYVPCGNATVTNCTFANAAAYSDDTNGKAVVNGVTYANGTTGITHDLTTRDALIKGFAEGGTVTLTGHSKLYNSSLTLPAGNTLTLDLNGKTLTWNAPAAYGFHNKGNLTIKNGTIIFTGNHSAGAAIINRGNITMEDVSITANAKCFYNSGSWTEGYTELETHGDSPTIVATITGGTFNSTPQHVTTGYHIYAIETEFYSKLVMKDAIVEGDGGVSVDASYAALTNVTATHTCTQGAHDIYVPCGNATITSCTYTNAAAYSDTEYGIAVVNETQYTIPEGQTSVTTPINLNN